jgi:hypothetical protein
VSITRSTHSTISQDHPYTAHLMWAGEFCYERRACLCDTNLESIRQPQQTVQHSQPSQLPCSSQTLLSKHQFHIQTTG